MKGQYIMKKAKMLTVTELAKRINALEFGKTLDFATGYAYLDKDLNKASEDDLTNWYGIKKIEEFDQDIVLIGGYGGDDSYAISYKRGIEPNNEFKHDLEVILNRIDVHCDGFTGIYVFENETTVCLDVQALYDVFKDGALSLCKIIFTDDGEGGTYCDLYNDNGELACMTGEEVYVTNIDEQNNNIQERLWREQHLLYTYETRT